MNADTGDKLLSAMAYVIVGGFIAMWVYGLADGTAPAHFDLLGIAAGAVCLYWVGRRA